VDITNAGRIQSAFVGIEANAAGDYSMKNLKTGLIVGMESALAIDGSGTHTIANAGSIQYGGLLTGYAITGQEGTEKITNWGSVFGVVSLGDGNDVFTNFKKVGHLVKNGVANSLIDLGAGDDRFNGGNKGEVVTDADGKDVYRLGGGKDYFYGYLSGDGDLVDVVDGGKGIDTYDASQSGVPAVSTVFLNLDKIKHGGITANLAIDYDANPHDIIRNFENAIGGDESDLFYGTKGVNELWGGGGNDSLLGFGGNDLLHGGSGADGLIGGAGRDRLWGDADADRFLFEALRDSGRTSATRDTIVDFEGAGVAGGDLIDLNQLNQKLGDIITDFLGVDVAFTGNKGDLRAVTGNNQTIVQLDVNGDKKADFSIALDGLHALTVDDFDL
jgi:serralysin